MHHTVAKHDKYVKSITINAVFLGIFFIVIGICAVGIYIWRNEINKLKNMAIFFLIFSSSISAILLGSIGIKLKKIIKEKNCKDDEGMLPSPSDTPSSGSNKDSNSDTAEDSISTGSTEEGHEQTERIEIRERIDNLVTKTRTSFGNLVVNAKNMCDNLLNGSTDSALLLANKKDNELIQSPPNADSTKADYPSALNPFNDLEENNGSGNYPEEKNPFANNNSSNSFNALRPPTPSESSVVYGSLELIDSDSRSTTSQEENNLDANTESGIGPKTLIETIQKAIANETYYEDFYNDLLAINQDALKHKNDEEKNALLNGALKLANFVNAEPKETRIIKCQVMLNLCKLFPERIKEILSEKNITNKEELCQLMTYSNNTEDKEIISAIIAKIRSFKEPKELIEILDKYCQYCKCEPKTDDKAYIIGLIKSKLLTIFQNALMGHKPVINADTVKLLNNFFKLTWVNQSDKDVILSTVIDIKSGFTIIYALCTNHNSSTAIPQENLDLIKCFSGNINSLKCREAIVCNGERIVLKSDTPLHILARNYPQQFAQYFNQLNIADHAGSLFAENTSKETPCRIICYAIDKDSHENNHGNSDAGCIRSILQHHKSEQRGNSTPGVGDKFTETLEKKLQKLDTSSPLTRFGNVFTSNLFSASTARQ